MLRRNSRTNKERFNDEETPFAEVTSPLGSRAYALGFDAEPQRGVSERNRRSRLLARRRPHARTSSSQATDRLRRAILFYKWLISRSFCCSSLSTRKQFIGLRMVPERIPLLKELLFL